MTADNRVVSCFATLLLLIECASTVSAAPMGSATHASAQITILYDAFGKTSTMQKDWGYAALVEYGGKRILFDAGNNPEILAQNTNAKGIDLTNLDFVVMSHRFRHSAIEAQHHGGDKSSHCSAAGQVIRRTIRSASPHFQALDWSEARHRVV